MVIAAAVVIVIAAGIFVALERGKPAPRVTPISAAPDPYAASLPLTNLAMSESSNLSGGKVTYLDGHIQNTGGRTVTGITVQVLYRDFAHEVVNNYTQPLTIIRMRDPYIDVGPISAAPLSPGAGADFRLIFDGVKSDWDGALPEVRLIRVDTK
jgi:hypothetical protein